MGAGYTWSGGPWIIDHWTKGVEVVLVPNENFWGAKPKLERVTFKIQADTAAEFESFQNREVAMIYPQPQPDVVEQIQAGLEDAESVVLARTPATSKRIWMNNASPPLDDVAVRQAIAYSIDRAAIVEQLFGAARRRAADADDEPAGPRRVRGHRGVLGLRARPRQGRRADDRVPAGRRTPTASGRRTVRRPTWSCKTTTGNARRELTEQILQDQLRDAGFDLTTDNQAAGDLFGQQLPAGEFQLALYAQVADVHHAGPVLPVLLEEHPDAGERELGSELDPDQRARGRPAPRGDSRRRSTRRAWRSWARRPTRSWPRTWSRCPLDPLPNILIWNNTVLGDVSDNPVLGPFHNLNELGVQQ